jgi:sodium/potassium-transporting ATPase subunit alpha
LQKIFWYFFGGFGSLLFGGGILVFISWKPLGHPPAVANLALAIVLLAVWVIQAAFNAWQDFSTSRVMSSITGMMPEDCIVLRDNTNLSIPAAEIVPGDVLFFKAGNKMPADVRFVEVTADAKFDRGILTGESVPIAAVTESSEKNYLETRCIGMQGTHCTSGSGIGIVVSTGDNTVFGHIAKLTTAEPNRATNLQKEIQRFVIIIATLMIIMCLIVIGVWAGYIRHAHPGYMPPSILIVNLVSVGIAFIPEGLPIAVTASLTIVADIMRGQQILCKSLKTVETLGSISVLLSDKTGTLTKNKMVVTDCLAGAKTMSAVEAADDKKGKSLQQLQIVGALCNAGEFDVTTNHLPLSERKIIGDATDQAILRFSESLLSVVESRAMWRKRYDIPFNSKDKFALRILSPATSKAVDESMSKEEASSFMAESDMLLVIKGAPDVLFTRCEKFVGQNGEVNALTDDVRASVNATKDAWSRDGKRVLLLVRKVVSFEEVDIVPEDGQFESRVPALIRSGLVLVGLVAMTDPPRDEIPELISTLRTAGVRTMMVTGDFKLTAQAIARQCGIITCSDREVLASSDLQRHPSPSSSPKTIEKSQIPRAIVLSGTDLPTLSEHQWSIILQTPALVFARTSPDQKLLIVQRFRAAGYVVGMTGDGVNDAPSLKEADIGIAPGSASDIALAASDMVLLASFSSIIPAVAYGRSVFINLKKTIAYLLPAGSYSEFWPVMTSVIFGLPQILSSFLMIIICCFTDCGAAVALAYEKPEADVLLHPPRDVKKDHLVDWKLLFQSYIYTGTCQTLISFSLSYWYLETKRIPFSGLWFSYGDYPIPAGESEEYTTHHLMVGSGIYFITLVVLQWFNLMCIRTRRLSLFQHPPLGNKKTQNLLLFPAILFSIVIAVIFIYIADIHEVAGSNFVPVRFWFIPFALGIGMLWLEEGRKTAVRRWPGGFLAKIAW